MYFQYFLVIVPTTNVKQLSEVTDSSLCGLLFFLIQIFETKFKGIVVSIVVTQPAE